MGLFDKLFGKTKTEVDANHPIYSEMLDEPRYWAIVEESRSIEDQEKRLNFLLKCLQELEPEDIIGFYLRTNKLLFDAYTNDLWCAAYIMNDGCSDDGFAYFRCWLIASGKEIYYRALNNPDTLADHLRGDEDDYDFEQFWYLALHAFEKKTGERANAYMDLDSFPYTEAHYPELELNWDEDDSETMEAICPSLFAAKWGKRHQSNF